jgi:deoxyribodipyrimidine photo-lyase
MIADPATATRAAGLARLESFLPHAGRDYAARRNFDFGPDSRANVSLLSPHIRHRLLLEPEVIAAVLARHTPSACAKFVQEVCWRTYWKGWLEHRPGVWSCYRDDLAGELARMDRDPGLADRYRGAVDGRTGIGCFDAWAAELVSTGFLHNHTRMWMASIWIFTLKLPWVLGADWFLRHLLDGDPASNTLSWRWVAGLQTRGKHYLARASNIAEYTGGRFDPRGELDEQALPLAPDEPAALQVPAAGGRLDPAAATGLLLTEEDASAESLVGGARILAVASAGCIDGRSPLPVGVPARRFADGALADARSRAARAFGCEAVAVDGSAEALVDWACSRGLRQLATARACVGPVRSQLDSLGPALAARGVALVELQRRWDRAAWPHATRGYFAFRERIGELTRDCSEGIQAA